MLVLRVKLGSEVVLSGGITLKVVGLGFDGVRLGFEAPKDVHIHRKDLLTEEQRDEFARTGEPPPKA